MVHYMVNYMFPKKELTTNYTIINVPSILSRRYAGA